MLRYGIVNEGGYLEYFDMDYELHSNPVPTNYLNLDRIDLDWDNVLFMVVI